MPKCAFLCVYPNCVVFFFLCLLDTWANFLNHFYIYLPVLHIDLCISEVFCVYIFFSFCFSSHSFYGLSSIHWYILHQCPICDFFFCFILCLLIAYSLFFCLLTCLVFLFVYWTLWMLDCLNPNYVVSFK